MSEELLKQDAERWSRAVEGDIERGIAALRASCPAVPLGQLLERYRLEVVPAFKGASEDEIRLKAIERARLCRTSLPALTPPLIAAYRHQRLGEVRTGTRMSASTCATP